MIRLYSICVKFSGERQGSKICDRKDGLQDLITFEKQNPSVSCISGVCLKSEPFTLRPASSVVRLTSLKCMDSALGQFQRRSRLTPTGYQATVRIHITRPHPHRPWRSALGTSPPPPSRPWSRRGDSSPCLISPAPRAPAVHSRKQTLHPPPSFWHRAPKILRIPKALSDTILSFVMFVR